MGDLICTTCRPLPRSTLSPPRPTVPARRTHARSAGAWLTIFASCWPAMARHRGRPAGEGLVPSRSPCTAPRPANSGTLHRPSELPGVIRVGKCSRRRRLSALAEIRPLSRGSDGASSVFERWFVRVRDHTPKPVHYTAPAGPGCAPR